MQQKEKKRGRSIDRPHAFPSGFLFGLAAELRDEVVFGKDLDPLLFRQLRFRAGMILGRDDQVIEFPSIGDIPTEFTN